MRKLKILGTLWLTTQKKHLHSVGANPGTDATHKSLSSCGVSKLPQDASVQHRLSNFLCRCEISCDIIVPFIGLPSFFGSFLWVNCFGSSISGFLVSCRLREVWILTSKKWQQSSEASWQELWMEAVSLYWQQLLGNWNCFKQRHDKLNRSP